MNTSEKTGVTPARKSSAAPMLFAVLSLLLLIALCVVSFLSYGRFNRRLDELETALAETQSSIAALSEAESRLALSLEAKADKEALDAFAARQDAEKTSFLRAVAHRGLSSQAPENTLPAFALAKQAGFSYVETDICFTADGYAVCLHDSEVDRTSNGSGAIIDLTLEQVRQLDFGSWYSEEYAGVTIPRFEEFLVLCRNLGLHPYVELKAGTVEQIRSLVKTADAYGMTEEISWISFFPIFLRAVKQAAPDARLGYLVGHIDPNVISEVSSLRSGTNRVFLNSSSFSEEEIQLCRDAGIPLEVWTIDAAYKIVELDSYISGVTSNSQRADQILAEMSLAG